MIDSVVVIFILISFDGEGGFFGIVNVEVCYFFD